MKPYPISTEEFCKFRVQESRTTHILRPRLNIGVPSAREDRQLQGGQAGNFVESLLS